MVMRRSEFVFILLAAAVVFFILGYFVSNKTQGRSFSVSAETAAYTAGVPAASAEPGAADSGTAPLDINSASAAQLASLPGVSASVAEAIVSFRETYGPFDRAEQILRVGGVDRELFLQIEQYIYAG